MLGLSSGWCSSGGQVFGGKCRPTFIRLQSQAYTGTIQTSCTVPTFRQRLKTRQFSVHFSSIILQLKYLGSLLSHTTLCVFIHMFASLSDLLFPNSIHTYITRAGLSSRVVTASDCSVRGSSDSGSNHAADSCVYRDSCCDIQSWVRAVHLYCSA